MFLFRFSNVRVHFNNELLDSGAVSSWIQDCQLLETTTLQDLNLYYRNEFYFCGFYRCVNSGESLTNWVKPEYSQRALSLWVIRRSLHIDKIHKNNNSFLIIPTLSSKSYFCRHYFTHFRNWRKEASSEIPVLGIYRSVKLFLQPIKLHEISIMMRTWNYKGYSTFNLYKIRQS